MFYFITKAGAIADAIALHVVPMNQISVIWPPVLI